MDLHFAATAKPFAAVIFCCTGVDNEERVTSPPVPIANSKVRAGQPRTTNGRGLQGRLALRRDAHGGRECEHSEIRGKLPSEAIT